MKRFGVVILRAGGARRVRGMFDRSAAEAWARSYNDLNRGLSSSVALALPHPLAAAISRASDAFRAA